jgi:hypothetical protein
MTATASADTPEQRVKAPSVRSPIDQLQIEYRRAEAAVLALPRRRPLTRLVAISEVRKRAARAANAVLDALSAMDSEQRMRLITDEDRTSLYEFARTSQQKSRIRPASLALKATHGLLPFLGITGSAVGAFAHSANKPEWALGLVLVYGLILQLISRALVPGRASARQAIGAPAAFPLVRRTSRRRVQPTSAYLVEVSALRSVNRGPLPDWPTDLLIKAGGALVLAVVALVLLASDGVNGNVGALVVAILCGLRLVWLAAAAIRRAVLRTRVRRAAAQATR